MFSVAQRLDAIRGLDLSAGAAHASPTLQELREGGYLDINGVTYRVDRLFRYLDVKWSSFKKRKHDYWVIELALFNVLTGQKQYLEWEVDDEIEISETLREVRLAQITVGGRALTRHDLEAIADEEAGTVTVAGVNYDYSEDDTWAALFYREDDAEPLPVRMYEFVSGSGEGLTIEAWVDEDDKPEREAFISRSVPLSAVTTLQARPAPSASSGVAS